MDPRNSCSRRLLFPGIAAAWLRASAITLSVAPGASAHALAADGPAGDVWHAWPWAPEILLGLGLAAAIFAAGVLRGAAISGWRQVSFYAGLGTLLLALQSPLDAIAGRLFAAHQIQHLLLRMIGPALLALAAPGPILLRGLPPAVRRRVVRPLGRARVLRWTRRAVGHPAVATTLYVGTLYFWQVPAFHDASVLDDPVHYGMHATMLLSGLLFWWCVLSPYAFPFGWRYGARVAVLWISVVGNLVLGNYVFLARRVLYGSYDALGRAFAIDAALDRQIGGLLLWIPPSMMTVVALLIVVSRWMHGDRAPPVGGSASAGTHPGGRVDPPVAPRAHGRLSNRVLTLALVLFVIVLFAATILVVGLALSTAR